MKKIIFYPGYLKIFLQKTTKKTRLAKRINSNSFITGIKFSITALAFFFASGLYAQKQKEITVKVDGAEIAGTLLTADTEKESILCIIVPGSGPTDRNGNNVMGLNTDAYKLLAEKLNANGFSVFRYDKRGIGKSKPKDFQEDKILFETNSDDLKAIIADLRKTGNFKKIFLAGHSEGALVAMICAKTEKADGLISISGAGKNAGDLILEQIEANKANPLMLKNSANKIIKNLQAGKEEKNVPVILQGLFRKSVQPYLISWFRYNPCAELASLDIPLIVIHGEADSQLPAEHAKLLASAKSGIKLHIIKNMTHTLKEVKNKSEEQKTYTNPEYPVSSELVKVISAFMN